MLIKSGSFVLQDVNKVFVLVRKAKRLLLCITLPRNFLLPVIGLIGLEVTCTVYLDTSLAGFFVESRCNV